MARKKGPEPLSVAAYAKRCGVTHRAIQKAIEVGRLSKSLVRVKGKAKIADPDLADRELAETGRPRADREESSAMLAGDDAATVANYYVSRALREAAMARKEAALADMAELDVLERKGELVPVADARAQVVDKFTVVKTKILSVPSRLAQRLPHVSADDVRVIEDLIREALEELSDGDGDSAAA